MGIRTGTGTGTSLPRLSWKQAVETSVVVVVLNCFSNGHHGQYMSPIVSLRIPLQLLVCDFYTPDALPDAQQTVKAQ